MENLPDSRFEARNILDDPGAVVEPGGKERLKKQWEGSMVKSPRVGQKGVQKPTGEPAEQQ